MSVFLYKYIIIYRLFFVSLKMNKTCIKHNNIYINCTFTYLYKI